MYGQEHKDVQLPYSPRPESPYHCIPKFSTRFLELPVITGGIYVCSSRRNIMNTDTVVAFCCFLHSHPSWFSQARDPTSSSTLLTLHLERSPLLSPLIKRAPTYLLRLDRVPTPAVFSVNCEWMCFSTFISVFCVTLLWTPQSWPQSRPWGSSVHVCVCGPGLEVFPEPGSVLLLVLPLCLRPASHLSTSPFSYFAWFTL